MFIKIESQDVAKALSDLGYHYTVEIINKKNFYCFRHSPELATVILNKFADARLIIDGHLCF